MTEYILHLGAPGIPLLLLSLLAMTLIIERSLFFIRRPGIQDSQTYRDIHELLQANAQQARQLRDDIASAALAEAENIYLRGISLLRLVAGISPLVGLLGTVLGMMLAFQDIASHQGPVTPALLADGLWQAMATTAVGLIIAIPSLFAAWLFRTLAMQRLERIRARLNHDSLRLEGANLPEQPPQSTTQSGR